MAHLKQVYATYINDETEIKPIDSLNELLKLKLEKKSLRYVLLWEYLYLTSFCFFHGYSMEVGMASSNERSFSKLAIIKNKLGNSTN